MKAMEYGPIVDITAGEAITKRRFVDFEGKHTANLRAIGVSQEDTDLGDPISVQIAGIPVVECGGAVTAGDDVVSDGEGRAITQVISTVPHLLSRSGGALDSGTLGTFIRVALR